MFFFYYLGQGFEHLEGEAHHSAVLAPYLEAESLIVVVDERFGEEPLVVVKTLGILWDGFVLYSACLLAHLVCVAPCYILYLPTSYRSTSREAHQLRGVHNPVPLRATARRQASSTQLLSRYRM